MPRSGKHIVATATRISAAGGRKAAKRCTDSRFAKPRIFIARAACCPDRGMLSMQWKAPERETRCYFLRRAKSNTKSTRDFVLRPRFKTLQNIFFVTFPFFVPKPACGAIHFFGCFEPVRKGCCSADARLMFFENGMLYSKLTQRNVFK